MNANTAAVLTFAGGVLAFAAAALPIIARIWQGAEPRARSYFLARALNNGIFLLFVSAVAARYIWHSFLVASILLYIYIGLMSWQFTRFRQHPVSRVELVLLVLCVAFTVNLASSYLDEAARHLAGQQATPAKP